MSSALASVVPQDAVLWLEDHGWKQVNPRGKPASLWQRQGRELLLPLQPATADYSLRMVEFLGDLANIEGKSRDSLQTEMLVNGADICEWRAEEASEVDGSIPLGDGEKLISSAKSAFIAAAAATIHRRGYFGHAVPQRARDHAQAIRMGQSIRGSYIIPIISRIPSEDDSDEQATLLRISQLEDTTAPANENSAAAVVRRPFSRQVMTTLAQGAEAVHRVATGDDPVNARVMNEVVSEGVSYELCNAISHALQSSSIGALDMHFSWSRRVPTPTAVASNLRFSHEIEPRLASMASALQGSPMIATQTIVGSVYALRHDTPEEDLVIVRTGLGDRRQIRMTLIGEMRHEAAVAYDTNSLVYVTGTLVRPTGKSWAFDQVTGFGVATPLALAQEELPTN